MFSTIDLKLEKWMEGMGPLAVRQRKSPHGPPTSKKLSTHQPIGRLTPPAHRPMNPSNPYMYRSVIRSLRLAPLRSAPRRALLA